MFRFCNVLILTFFFGLGFVIPLCGQVNEVFPDGIGNYWVLSDAKVSKLNIQGQIVAHYSNILLGKPTSIDASDPFRVLVFYQHHQTLLFLNNDAAIIGKPINLTELGLGEITLACRSSLEGFWLLHREAAELIRYNNQLTTIMQRISLDDNFQNINSTFMQEYGGVIYICLEQDLIKRFDVYGAKISPLEIYHDGRIRIEAYALWTKRDEYVFRYNLNDLNEKPETYRCPCASLPFTINKEVVCFNGVEFIFCEKNNL